MNILDNIIKEFGDGSPSVLEWFEAQAAQNAACGSLWWPCSDDKPPFFAPMNLAGRHKDN